MYYNCTTRIYISNGYSSSNWSLSIVRPCSLMNFVISASSSTWEHVNVLKRLEHGILLTINCHR
jgi:hypothetical protein